MKPPSRRSLARALALAALWSATAGSHTRAAAQAPRRPSFNATIALGGGAMGFSALVSGAIRYGQWMTTLRTTGNLPPAGRPVATDIALLQSFVVLRTHSRLEIGTGVALVETGDSSRTYAEPYNAQTHVGLPLQAAALWRPAPGIGLGLLGVADLNPRKSFWSILAGLQLGRFD